MVSFSAQSSRDRPHASGLRIEVSNDRDITTMHVNGDVDLATASLMSAAADYCLQGSPLRVVVDLSRVAFFGATGLTVLLRLREHTDQAAIDLVLRAPSPAVRTVLDIVDASRCFRIESGGFHVDQRGHSLASNAVV